MQPLFPKLFLFLKIMITMHTLLILRRAPNPSGPSINDANLTAELFVHGLKKPTSMAFLGPNDILVLEKKQEE